MLEKKKFFLFSLETVKTVKMMQLHTWALFPKRSVFESTVFEQEQHLIDSRSI